MECTTIGNPYEEELSNLVWDDADLRCLRPPQPYPRMEDTPLVYVSTEPELRDMVDEIKSTCQGKEIAVDVEHHDLRSYYGFVCLVQISTRNKDFIVDPFNIFAEMHMLNEVFSDPGIRKILHGADRDVMWLQRDFSVYLVNMFDTGLATRELGLQGGFSLANLVARVCKVSLDKQHQLSDWRQRPLSEEMTRYARSDTHYLLYCYDCLWNALVTKKGAGAFFGLGHDIEGQQCTDVGVQALKDVLDRSRKLCIHYYAHPQYNVGNAALKLTQKFGVAERRMTHKQFELLQALLQWRDGKARALDESMRHIAPDACLWRIALAMPTTPLRLRSTAGNPVPVAVQSFSAEILAIVQKLQQQTGQAEHAAVQRKRSIGAVEGQSREEKAARLEEGPAEAIATVVSMPALVRPAAPDMTKCWPAPSCTDVQPLVNVQVTPPPNDNSAADGAPTDPSGHKNGAENRRVAWKLWSIMPPNDSDEEDVLATKLLSILQQAPHTRRQPAILEPPPPPPRLPDQADSQLVPPTEGVSELAHQLAAAAIPERPSLALEAPRRKQKKKRQTKAASEVLARVDGVDAAVVKPKRSKKTRKASQHALETRGKAKKKKRKGKGQQTHSKQSLPQGNGSKAVQARPAGKTKKRKSSAKGNGPEVHSIVETPQKRTGRKKGKR
mmetsp:Transcript_47866/g.107437  ORF Transcript_47866/g.107437 Transcript_47866/m.107437 type:complete len:668 (-) Transcript_47866:210-2213(-)